MTEFERGPEGINKEGGMERHPSGLIVPEGMGLTREAWTNDDMKKLRRTSKFAQDKHLKAVFYCDDCDKLVQFVVDKDYGSLKAMECDCKRRVVID